MYGGVRGRKTRVGEKLHRFPPTRLCYEWMIISPFVRVRCTLRCRG